MTLSISPVRTSRDRRAFYNLAWRVYRDDPQWVPHLWPQRKAYLTRQTAFFTYGEGEFWLARRGSEVVGTIGTAIDHSHNRHRGRRTAFFGFFEVLPHDYDAAAALWDHACAWAHAHDMEELIGPQSFNANEDYGFLIEGFEYAPCVMMGHTPPYYATFAERYGFEKLLDSLAYRIEAADYGFDIANIPPVMHRIADRVLERHGPHVIRKPDMDHWEEEAERLRLVYNRSLAVLPEFTPMEAAEFRAQAQDLKPILDVDLVLIAEIDGKTVGFALGLPNFMEALQHAHGLRYPWDYVRFMRAQREITGVSFKILAIDPDYWGYGLEALMFREMGRTIIEKGYTWVDASLTAETNPQTNKLAARFGARVYRRYRQYRLAL